jgi:hypothetical protein
MTGRPLKRVPNCGSAVSKPALHCSPPAKQLFGSTPVINRVGWPGGSGNSDPQPTTTRRYSSKRGAHSLPHDASLEPGRRSRAAFVAGRALLTAVTDQVCCPSAPGPSAPRHRPGAKPHAIVRVMRWNRGPLPVRTSRPSLQATMVVVVHRLFVLRDPPQRYCGGSSRAVGRAGPASAVVDLADG